jgi:hypothetical protein
MIFKFTEYFPFVYLAGDTLLCVCTFTDKYAHYVCVYVCINSIHNILDLFESVNR